MRNIVAAMCAALLVSASLIAAPTTGPTSLEVRALQEFNLGNYAIALPMLQQVRAQFADQPDKLGAIDEAIRVSQRNIAQGVSGIPTTQPEVTNATRQPQPAPVSGKVFETTIKGLGNFEFDADKGSPIPDDVKAYSGTSVRLHGYMIPIDQADKITQFALVPSLFACCFGQPPQIQHTIIVTCPKGKAVSYYPDEIVIEGTLNVQVKKEDGFITSIFQMTAASVKPAAK